MQNLSPEYLQLIHLGPFPNHIDPWVEQGRYFHQLHAQMIGYLLEQIGKPVYELGYQVGRETSLQITSMQPDLFLEEWQKHPPKNQKYADAAATLELEAGTILALPEYELDRLFIEAIDTGNLVTVIEIISPSNKTNSLKIEKYQMGRRSLLEQGVNIVEIDFTRSVKRLLDNSLVDAFPYHILVYPHAEEPHFLGMNLNDAPKAFALPLRDEVIRAELNPVYRRAYAQLFLASQILNHTKYSEDSLPFPSLFKDEELKAILTSVETWQAALKTAQASK